MVFRPYPQVIRCFFNNNRFGPPPRVTGGSACPGIDHPASGLPWRTQRAIRTRLRFGSAIWLNLARHGNSQAHYAKGMRSPLRAPTVWGRMISGSVSLPSKGFFSPFPHGTCALSVGSGIQPCGMGSADSDGVSRVPPYLGCSCAIRGSGHGAVTRCGAPFQKLALASLGTCGVPQPRRMNPPVWAPPRSLATTCGISVDFSSSGY